MFGAFEVSFEPSSSGGRKQNFKRLSLSRPLLFPTNSNPFGPSDFPDG